MNRTLLMEMTVKDLRECATCLEIKRVTMLKKSELVDELLKMDETVLDAALKKVRSAQAVETDADKTTALEAASDKTDNTPDKSTKCDNPPVSDKAKKTVKVSNKADAEALEKDADAVLDKDGKPLTKTANVDEKEKKDDEQPPVEPDSIFIDHGAILPEFIPGTCLYALVRDPGTLFVYWNASFESTNGWLLTAYDAAGNVLQEFTTPARRNGRGYFRVPTAQVARVTLSIIENDGRRELRLESKIRIAQQLGIAQPAPAYDERWVDVHAHKVIFEAPAPGRAPINKENSHPFDISGGGFDRSLDSACHQAPGQATSSRFGSLPGEGVPNAPSSDTLLGSSDRIVRH